MISNVLIQTGVDDRPLGKSFGSGVHPSLHPLSIPLWRDVRNVRFFGDRVEKMAGWSTALTSGIAVPIRGMQQLLLAASQNLFYGTTTNLYRWTGSGSPSSVGSSYTGITNETVLAPASYWSMERWGNWLVATNGVDAPQIWKTTTFSALDVDSQFTTAEIFVRRGPHMLAFNTSAGRDTFHWCAEDDIEDWDTATQSAGNLTIRDISSKIIAAVPLGDQIAVYSKDQMYLVRYSGSPFYFGYFPALEEFGPVGKAAVVPVGRRNYGFGKDRIWVTDGTQVEYIDGPNIHHFIYDNLNTAQLSKVCGYHEESFNMVVFYYPTSGSSEPDRGVGYDYKTGTWTILDFGRTSAIPKDVFAYPVAAKSDGSVYFHEVGTNDDSSAMTAYVESTRVPLAGEEAKAFVESVKVSVKSLSGTVELYLGKSDRLDDAITWATEQNLDDGNEPLWFDFENIRYFCFKILSDTTGADWAVNGIRVMGTGTGRDP